MLKRIPFLNKYLSNKRSNETFYNWISLFALKGGAIILNFIIISISINYISSKVYGIWLAVSSLISWFSFLDIGLNNGLRNKFTEAKALGNNTLAKELVSTTYFFLFLISFLFLFIFLIANSFIDWYSVFNLAVEDLRDISAIIIIIVFHFVFKFTFTTIYTILYADQKPALVALGGLLEQVLICILLIISFYFWSPSLILYSVIYCISPLLVLFLLSIILFRKQYKPYTPSITSIHLKHAKGLFGLGWKFFIIQIASIIQFQTTNFLILKFFNPEDVTSFNIAYKYFSVLLIVMTIIMTPIWSSVTESYTKKDFGWIKNTVRICLIIFLILLFVGIFMLCISNWFYDFWIGSAQSISIKMSIFILLNILTISFGSIFVNVLNGMSKVNIQFISSFISPIVFILLSILLIKYTDLGIIALMVASIISNFNGFLLAPLQYYFVSKREFNNAD